MDFPTLLIALASELRISHLEIDEHGCCQLEIDGMPLLLCTTPERNAVALMAQAGVVAPQDCDRLESLLTANLTCTSDIQLSVDANKNVVITQWLPLAELQFFRFFQVMEDFINYLEFWTESLSRAPTTHLPGYSNEYA